MASCRAGAFLFQRVDSFGPSWPEVRPRCRSPPAPFRFHATRTPRNETEEIFVREETEAELYAALAKIPAVQARRIFAHYILGMKKVDIVRAEGVCDSCVCGSIKTGLANLKKILKETYNFAIAFLRSAIYLACCLFRYPLTNRFIIRFLT